MSTPERQLKASQQQTREKAYTEKAGIGNHESSPKTVRAFPNRGAGEHHCLYSPPLRVGGSSIQVL